MRRIHVPLPLLLPEWLYGRLKRPSLFKDLSGDRNVEWSFCAAHMPMGPGEAIDFGCGVSWMGLLAARRGFSVTAVDLEEVRWPYQHPGLRFLKGDLVSMGLPLSRYRLIINCSSVEHVGLTGRFGVAESRADGDLEVMAVMRRLLESEGMMLLTIPVGQDAVHAPWHRVYGQGRLPYLLNDYVVQHEEYWLKDEANRWIPTDRETALSSKPTSPAFGRWPVYALGCFVLQRPPMAS